jgi:hypothetical protein
MNLVIDEKYFPLWLVPKSTISDERLKHLREANATLDIKLEPSGELYIKPIAASPRH